MLATVPVNYGECWLLNVYKNTILQFGKSSTMFFTCCWNCHSLSRKAIPRI